MYFNQTYLYHIVITALFSLMVTSCSEEKEVTESEESAEVEHLANTFFTYLDNGDYYAAKQISNNASISSIELVKNAPSDLILYLMGVDSCNVDSNTAVCSCRFTYYENQEFTKDLHLKKYKDEWKVDFQLGVNFDNIYLYDYSNVLNEDFSKNAQKKLSTESKENLKQFIKGINSNGMVLGFSNQDEVAQADKNGYKMNDFVESIYQLGELQLSNTYYFKESKLDNYYGEVDALKNANTNDYYQDFVETIQDELGKPFNIPNDGSQNIGEYYELRWFIKSYNEILQVSLYSDYFYLELLSAP